MPTIYQKLKRIARSVVKHYHSDLYVHDRARLAKLQTGEVMVWSPREHGTHLYPVSARGAVPSHDTLAEVKHSLDWFDSTIQVFGAGNWYMLESTAGRHGHVVAVSVGEARQLYIDRIAAIERGLVRQANEYAHMMNAPAT